MTLKMPSKPSSEQLLTLSPLLQHQGKPRYSLEDLQRGVHSILLLCSRLQSSLPSESCKQILTSFQECLEPSSRLLDDHLTSLIKNALSSQEDPPPQT